MSRVARALLPGERRVWLTAAGLGAFFLVAIAVSVLLPRDHYTGTNSVRTRSFPVELGPGQQLCVRDQRLPGGTGQVELEIATPLGPRPRLDLEVRPEGRAPVPGRTVTGPTRGRAKVRFEIPEVPGTGDDFLDAAICLRSAGDHVFVGGVAGVTSADPAGGVTVAGHPIRARVAIWYRPPPGEKRSVAGLAPEILKRAALFRPGFVDSKLYALLLGLVLPAMLYGGVRLIATSAAEGPVAGGGSRRVPSAAWVAALAFGFGCSWAVLTPPFDAPDESEHFAYAQHLAETGDAPSGAGSPYSSAQRIALERLRVFSSNERGDGKPPWLAVDESGYDAAVAAARPRRDDGGGEATATGVHSPLYYSLLVPAYRATRGQSIWTQLTALRVVSALLGAIVAACALLLVRELVPGHPAVAAAAGLMVAFQPMFGFMSGAVNNDMGVNAAAAVLLLLLVRAVVRGLTMRRAVAIGFLLAIAPLMKGTAYALYPAAALALAAILWRERSTRAVRSAGALAGAAVATFLVWTAVSGAFERDAFTTPGGGAPGTGSAGLDHPLGLLSYIWQVLLPPLPGAEDLWRHGGWPFYDVWVVRGWGSFGWYAMTFADWVYVTIAMVMAAVLAASVRAVWVRRRRLGARAPAIAVLAVAIVFLVAGVHSYYYPEDPEARAAFYPEQGRYAFPVITALAAVAVGAAFAFGRRLVVPVATALAVAVMGMGYAAQLLALARFYS